MLNWLVLEHPSRHADLDRLNDPALVPARCNDHNPHIWMVRQRLVRKFDPVSAVKFDIKQNDVESAFGERRAGLLDCGHGGCGQPWLNVEPAGQSFRERDIVVHHQELPDWRLGESQRFQGGRALHKGNGHPLAAACFAGGPSEY